MTTKTVGRDGKHYPSQHHPNRAARDEAIVTGYLRGGYSMNELADQHGVSIGTVHRVIRQAIPVDR